MIKHNNESELHINGHIIQVDRSGQGHDWQDIPAGELPAAVREELEGEIVGGGDTGQMTGSNGIHYRWLAAPAFFGDLHNYTTGDFVRIATKAEYRASLAAGPEGVIEVVIGDKKISCYVQD